MAPPPRRHRRRSLLLPLSLAVALLASGAGALLWTLREEAAAERAREEATAAFLRALAAAEAGAMAAALVDLDGDGRGEALTWQELAGQAGLRRSPDGALRGPAAAPPPLDPGLRRLVGDGIVHEETASGFLLRIHLPSGAATGLHERLPGAAFPGAVDGERAEAAWVAHAWPRGGGGWAWAVRPGGAVLRSSNADLRYSAADRTPAFDASAPPGADPWAPPPEGPFRGRDGGTWEPWPAR